MSSIEMPTPGDRATKRYDTAEETMRAVNHLRGLQIEGFVIRDADGAKISDQQLAMIVMEGRLHL